MNWHLSNVYPHFPHFFTWHFSCTAKCQHSKTQHIIWSAMSGTNTSWKSGIWQHTRRSKWVILKLGLLLCGKSHFFLENPVFRLGHGQEQTVKLQEATFHRNTFQWRIDSFNLMITWVFRLEKLKWCRSEGLTFSWCKNVQQLGFIAGICWICIYILCIYIYIISVYVYMYIYL